VALSLGVTCLVACTSKPVEPPAAAPEKKEADVELEAAALESAKLVMAKPRQAPRRSSVVAAGTIDFVPSRVARIGPIVEGRVATVKVEPGQTVLANAALATVQSVEAGKVRAEWMAAKVRLEQANAELERQEWLAKGHATTEQLLITARAEKAVAEVTVRSAAERLQTLGAGGSTHITLTTPLAGTVLAMDARVGQAVGASDILFVVGTVDEVWLDVDVYERDLEKVHIGDSAHVTVLAYESRVFTGRVDHIGAVVDPKRRAISTRIVLTNADGALRPGMTATARLLGDVPNKPSDAGVDAGQGPLVMLIPRGALQTIDGLPYVFVEVSKGKFDARPIERGVEVEGEIEVLHGLEGNESVVVEGAFILKSEYLRAQMGSND
jgi:membrane fusion protein, heavy metal efflux system